MSESLVSVIVPVYNVSEYLEECWNSIARQTYDNIEIILVDDGSTDGSGKLCDELSRKEYTTIVIHRENGGLAAARNSGLDVCSGEYITFVDSDDMIAPNMIEDMVSAINETDADIVQCDYFRYENREEINNISHNQVQIEITSGKKFVGTENYKDIACAKLYKNVCWQNIRFREEIIHEDYALIYKIVYEAFRVTYIEDILYYARIRSGSITQLGFRRESLILVELSEERIEYFQINNERKLSDKAYTSYYDYLLSFYNQIRRCNNYEKNEKKSVCESLLRKYRNNIFRFLNIESIQIKTKIKLICCYFVPGLWKC